MEDRTENYMKTNLDRWNEMVTLHEQSAFYDVPGFKAGRITVSQLERDELGDVSGKSLLHLQCHFGMDTMSWARLGARATGVDFSDKAIALAQSLAGELGIDARFVCSNIYELPNDDLIPDKFDIVYTALGALSWLPDLQHWAKVISHYLKPGGIFYILEAHPFMFSLDENTPDFKVVYPYFSSDALKFEEEYSYASDEVKLANKTEYGWNHSLGEIINSLISQGLNIEFLHEFPFCGWSYFKEMEKGDDTWYRLKDESKRDLVPLMFSLKATRR
ncbi:MAG: class I SAM-dependent methyltransferase [Chloroflexi bacterium]|nr:class I SAM-dependent methyltransferase [Chloroflexota bacterium]